MVKEFISQLPPDKLSPFEKHPYQGREDAAMDELTESIRVHGVLHEKTLRGPKYGYRSPHYFKIASWDEYYNIAMSAALLLLSILYALLRRSAGSARSRAHAGT